MVTYGKLKDIYKQELAYAEEAEANAAQHGSDEDIKDATEHVQEMQMVLQAIIKQTVKKPKRYLNSKDMCTCPMCDRHVFIANYCAFCGQRLLKRESEAASDGA